MPSGDRRVSLETLRAAARERVAGSSLRQVAREIGIQHDALARFLRGSQPYGRTVAKLQAWYTGEANEMERLRQRVAELEKKLAACEAKLGQKR